MKKSETLVISRVFGLCPPPFDNDLITILRATIILYPKWLVGYQNNYQVVVVNN